MSLVERLALRGLGRLDPERAHDLALNALRLAPRSAPPDPILDPILKTSVMGLSLPTPVGVAAGFDKNARAPDAMLKRGFGFVEIGAVTPRAQAGNPRPRLFRLAEDRAAINRFGFNNDGLDAVAARLRAGADRRDRRRVWANIGANKESADRAGDYLAVLDGLHGLVGAMTLNISSPNTERLRELQGPAALEALIARALERRSALAKNGERMPILVKIAPDLEPHEIRDIAAVAMNAGVDGIVATNTTLARDGLVSRHAREAGGLSGAPLKDMALRTLRLLRAETKGALALVGVGGVGSAADAYERIRAGADLVQLYTAMVYEGPSLGARINKGLAALLKRDGFAGPAEAAGIDAAR